MSRNIDFRSEAFADYAKLVGEAALVWNDLHMVLSDLFHAASKIPNGLVSDAIWNALTSDRSQREIIMSLVKLKALGHNISKPIRNEIKWVLDTATELEEIRNNLIHSPVLMLEDGAISPWHHLGHNRAKKLSSKNLFEQLNWFCDVAMIIREYAQALAQAIRQPSLELPDKPKLPNKPLKT